MKGKTFLFLAACSMVFLGACSWSNKIPSDMPASIQVPANENNDNMDETISDESALDEASISEDEVEMQADFFDEIVDAEKDIEVLEEEVDVLLDEYETMFK